MSTVPALGEVTPLRRKRISDKPPESPTGTQDRVQSALSAVESFKRKRLTGGGQQPFTAPSALRGINRG